MSDRQYPIGQNIPVQSFRRYPSASTSSRSQAGSPSFQNVLNQSQREIHGSSAPATNSTGQAMMQAHSLPPQFEDETRALLDKLNPQVKAGQQFNQNLLESHQQYAEMKQAEAKQPAQNANPGASVSSSFSSALSASANDSASKINPFTGQPIEAPVSQPIQAQTASSVPESRLEPVIGPEVQGNPLLEGPSAAARRPRWSEFEPMTQQSTQINTPQANADSSPAESKGVGESFFGFFKNVASFLTLGFYRPDNEPAPSGMMRVAYPFKKLLWDAPKSLVYDTPASAIRGMSGSGESAKQTRIAQAEATTSRSDRFGSSSKPWLRT